MENPRREGMVRWLLPFGVIGAALLIQIAASVAAPKIHNFPYAFFYIMGIFAVAWRGGYLSGGLACLLAIIVIPFATHRADQPLRPVDPSTTALVLATSLLISKV